MKIINRGFLVSLVGALAVWSAPSLAEEQPEEWVTKAMAQMPPGYVAGRVYSLDKQKGLGKIAAFKVGSDDPQTPASAFDPGFKLEVKLDFSSDQPMVVSVAFAPRDWNDAAVSDTDYDKDLRQELKATAKKLPKGTEPCRIYGWSASDDKKGLKVRAQPDDGAKIVGRLAPPYLPPDSENAPEVGWRTEFTVIGYKKGWFLIDDILEPGEHYTQGATDGRAKSYKGRGWVRNSEVAAAYAYTEMPVSWLLQAPNVDAKAFVQSSHTGSDGMPIDGTLKTLFACSAHWALTENVDGIRGWWRGICSNQATNCS